MKRRRPAAEVANWQGPGRLWLDHAEVREEDLEWMAPARILLLWNVHLPEGALARLPNLAGVSLRGGSGTDLAALRGCASLLMADVNQIRGLHDLEELRGLRSLELLSLYGLPRVETIPDLRPLDRLRHAQLGSMKGLRSLAGLAAAPNLAELSFARMVNVSDEDVELLARHPTLEAFEWFALDLPYRVFEPLASRLAHLRKPPAVRAEVWLERRLEAGSA